MENLINLQNYNVYCSIIVKIFFIWSYKEIKRYKTPKIIEIVKSNWCVPPGKIFSFKKKLKSIFNLLFFFLFTWNLNLFFCILWIKIFIMHKNHISEMKQLLYLYALYSMILNYNYVGDVMMMMCVIIYPGREKYKIFFHGICNFMHQINNNNTRFYFLLLLLIIICHTKTKVIIPIWDFISIHINTFL